MNKLRQFFRNIRKPRGFTLAELMVATIIFGLSMVVITSASINFYRGTKRQLSRDTLFEETRVLLDRIVREAHLNTIDYDEYYNRIERGSAGYGEIYREYFHNFFYVYPPVGISVDISCLPAAGLNDPARYAYDSSSPCRAQHVNEGFYSTAANDVVGDDVAGASALNGVNQQTELYLMSADGKQKTILKRIGNNLDDDRIAPADDGADGDTGLEQVGILVLDLEDNLDNSNFSSAGADGYYDSWEPNDDFPPYTDAIGTDDSPFIPISPPTLEVTRLDFFVSPIEDPHKAFDEGDVRVQVHPNVTIILTTQVSADTARKFHSDTPPSITLQTTVSSRVYQNVLIPFAVN